MAREARERERRELIEGDKGSELEKEIGARLVKLEKRLNSKSEKLQDSFTEYLGLFGDFRDGSDSKEENKTLMFKKKFRFKSPSMDARSTPKCFSGLKDDSGVSKSGTDLNGLSRKTDVRSLKKDTGRKDGSVQLNSVKNKGNKVEKKGANLRKEMGSGSVHEIKEGRPSNEDPEAGKSRDLGTFLTPLLLRTVAMPIISVICLSLFFEDFGDFSADIVPLQVKELHDAVKLHSKKVIVVKKGQLKRYAGQPFSEVEMALYSLFEQD